MWGLFRECASCRVVSVVASDVKHVAGGSARRRPAQAAPRRRYAHQPDVAAGRRTPHSGRD